MPKEEKNYPDTINEAVRRLLSMLSEEEKEDIKNITKEDLVMLHHYLEPYIENEFGLWKKDRKPLGFCDNSGPFTSCGEIEPDKASSFIIDYLLNELREKDKFRRITLERTRCLGDCPIYKVTVLDSGKVEWFGEEFVAKKGKHEWEISEEQIRELTLLFAKHDYFSFKEQYVDIMMTCFPTCITSLEYPDGRFKKVEHYHGDTSSPKELGALENEIDRLIGTKEYIETKEPIEEKDDQPKIIDNEKVLTSSPSPSCSGQNEAGNNKKRGMSKGAKEGVFFLLFCLLFVLFSIYIGNRWNRPVKEKPESLTWEQQMEESSGGLFVFIAIRNNTPTQTVKEILTHWEEKVSFYPTTAETESAIEGYAQKYQIPKEKIANILWDWMTYNGTVSDNVARSAASQKGNDGSAAVRSLGPLGD